MAVEVPPKEQRDLYLGETRKQLRDGFGVYNYSNKFFRYEGEWKNGKKNGHGKLSMADGSYYEGEFQNGEIQGHGFRFWSGSRNIYSGQFYQGELHGQGIMNYADGSSYEGEWVRNRRQGNGKFKDKNNCVYEGQFHDHKKHGEGTQVYPNGDEYSGDWILGKRQGIGELTMADGSVYNGAWRGDMFNGQGMLNHSSGFVYDGMWINNHPAVLATKIVVTGIENNYMEITQGETFAVQVETRNDDDELIEDMGRELQLICGLKWQPTKEAKEAAAASKEGGAGLFDMLEEMDEKTLPTPFGYEMVVYPLTDQPPSEALHKEDTMLSYPKSTTNLSEQALQEDLGEQDTEDRNELEVPGGDVDGASSLGEPSRPVSAETGLPPQDDGVDVPEEATPLPPQVSNLRTDTGQATWDPLYLPPPPPGYRPFALLEGGAGRNTATPSGKKSRSKTSTKESSRPSTKAKSSLSIIEDTIVRPGEYVIMVQDVTNPPFMGKSLEPVFVMLKVKKKKKAPSGVDGKKKGPKWSTKDQIAQAMVRSYTDMADEEYG